MIFLSIVGLLFSFIVFCLFFYKIVPATTKRITLKNSNGRTLIYEGMCHVGSSNYYKETHDAIVRAKELGYSYFYEGIKPSLVDNDKYLYENRRFTCSYGKS